MSVKGSVNLAKLVEALSDTEIQFHIFIDSHQAQKEPSERYYAVGILEEDNYIGNWSDDGE